MITGNPDISTCQQAVTMSRHHTTWVSIQQRKVSSPPSASAPPHTFNTLTTRAFGSFARRGRARPAAAPRHPVPDAPAISDPAGGQTDIKEHFADQLVSSLLGADGEPSGRAGQSWVQFVLRENQAV